MSIVSPTPLIAESLVKPLASAGVAVLLDRMVLKQTDLKKNISFGLSVGAGIGLGSMVAKALPIPDSPSTFANQKQIASRLIEVTSGCGTAYVVNRFVMKNDVDRAGMIRKVGVILASDFIGEYLCDYFSGRPLAFFA
jgi:hypothetical protein